MNTAAALMGGTTLQTAPLADPMAPAAAGCGDFSAAMAAAAIEDTQGDVIDEAQTAAAMALLASMLATGRPAEPAQSGTLLADAGSGAELIEGVQGADQALPASAPEILLSELPGRVPEVVVKDAAPAVAAPVEAKPKGRLRENTLNMAVRLANPAGPEAELQTEPAAVQAQASPSSASAPAETPVVAAIAALDAALRRLRDSAPKAPDTARPAAPKVTTEAAPIASTVTQDFVPETIVAAEVVADIAPVATPVAAAAEAPRAAPAEALIRALGAQARPELPAAKPVDDTVAAVGKTPEVTLVDRVAPTLPERNVAQPEKGDSSQSITGSNLYTSARDAVGTAQPQAPARPEVVHAPVGSPRWASELGSRLVTMAVRGQQEGSISLTPEHLGPIEVRITTTQDGTNVFFGAQQADTRAALSDSLPRLREMFAASGLALGQAGVSHEMPRQEARQNEPVMAANQGNFESAEVASAPVVARARASLLDTWA